MTPDEALAYLEACRDSHVDAVANDDPLVLESEVWDAVGDKAFHEECVEGYNAAIEALRPLVEAARPKLPNFAY